MRIREFGLRGMRVRKCVMRVPRSPAIRIEGAEREMRSEELNSADFGAGPRWIRAPSSFESAFPHSSIRHPHSAFLSSAFRNRSVDDASCGGQSDDQEDQEQDQEQTRKKLRDRERCAGNRREPEEGRDDADNEKHKRHVEHAFNPPLVAVAKRVP